MVPPGSRTEVSLLERTWHLLVLLLLGMQCPRLTNGWFLQQQPRRWLICEWSGWHQGRSLLRSFTTTTTKFDDDDVDDTQLPLLTRTHINCMRIDQLRFELRRRYIVGEDFEQPDFANLKRKHMIPLLKEIMVKTQRRDQMEKQTSRTRQQQARQTKGRQSTRLYTKTAANEDEQDAGDTDAETTMDELDGDEQTTTVPKTSPYTLSIKGMKDTSSEGGTGVGCLLVESNTTTPVWSHGVYFPASRTAYEAEYTALILGLRRLDATTDTLHTSSSLQPVTKPVPVTIQTDNDVVYEQMGTRRFAVQKPSLVTLANQVEGLLKFHLQHHWSLQWQHVPKDELAPARQLAAQALEDQAPEPMDMIDDDPMGSFWDSVLPMPSQEQEEKGVDGIQDETAGDYEKEQVLNRLFFNDSSNSKTSKKAMSNEEEQETQAEQVVNPFAHFDDDDWADDDYEEADDEENEDAPSASSSLQSHESLELSSAAPPLSLDPSFTYILQFDGGSRGNPGVAGCGAAILVNDSPVEYGESSEVWHGYQYLGSSGVTNNQAEYQGFIFGLQRAHALGVRNIQCQGDSQLVIRQLLGEYKVKNERLQKLHTTAMACMDLFDHCELQHVMRKDNQRADKLANMAMDQRASFDGTGIGNER